MDVTQEILHLLLLLVLYRKRTKNWFNLYYKLINMSK
jgi:hypothetical protein